VENFVDKFLLGNTTVSTKISTSPYYTDLSPWITWATPTLTPLSSTGNSGTVIDGFKLEQNYPNPFNPTTEIRYQIPKASRVSVKVYDTLGRQVAVLFEGMREPGRYTATFDAVGLAAGTYVCKMTAGDFVGTKRLVFLK
jgi:hypothetical protein